MKSLFQFGVALAFIACGTDRPDFGKFQSSDGDDSQSASDASLDGSYESSAPEGEASAGDTLITYDDGALQDSGPGEGISETDTDAETTSVPTSQSSTSSDGVTDSSSSTTSETSTDAVGSDTSSDSLEPSGVTDGGSTSDTVGPGSTSSNFDASSEAGTEGCEDNEGNRNSDPHATCANIAGAFACTCDAGYKGTGVDCEPVSCVGLARNCGASLNDSCCTSLTVTGGEFGLGDPAMSAATVATFTLDKYEVTVGRFRKFVEAYVGPPAAGSGSHPMISGSGWQAAWNSSIAATASELIDAVQCDTGFQTWDAEGDNQRLPINCVDWYEAFAFCAWDGGRLPTEVEWEYAAAGGDAERIYPWGPEQPTDALAVYSCTGDGSAADDFDCDFSDILPVGSKPAGAGRFGQLDLAGSMGEWVLDTYSASYPSVCDNCANLESGDGGSQHTLKGGYWLADASALRAVYRYAYASNNHVYETGFRCARQVGNTD